MDDFQGRIDHFFRNQCIHFAILIIFVAPQIYTSITDISVQFPIWFESAQKFIIELEQNHPDWAKFLDYEQINNYIQSALQSP